MTTQKVYYPNMDLLRYALAIVIIVVHFNELGRHEIPLELPLYESVGAFFALSGFLIYPSYKHHRELRDYIRRRARRILPPYFFIVIACAIGLVGVSTISAAEYFTSGQFWGYLGANLTFLNFLQPKLPGVFQGSDYVLSAVNGALWTMKIEWCLYLSVPIVVWLIHRYKWNEYKTACAIVVLSISYRVVLEYFYSRTGIELLEVLSRQFFGQLSYFYVGVIIYLKQKQFKSALPLCAAAAIILYLACMNQGVLRIIISPISISALALAVSLTERTPNILRHRNNVSYEMYLFHFPLIQLGIYTGVNALPVGLSLPVVLATTVGLAAAWKLFQLGIRS